MSGQGAFQGFLPAGLHDLVNVFHQVGRQVQGCVFPYRPRQAAPVLPAVAELSSRGPAVRRVH
jgi:hypothetical protein